MIRRSNAVQIPAHALFSDVPVARQATYMVCQHRGCNPISLSPLKRPRRLVDTHTLTQNLPSDVEIAFELFETLWDVA